MKWLSHRWILLVLTLVLVLGLAGCNRSAATDPTATPESETEEEPAVKPTATTAAEDTAGDTSEPAETGTEADTAEAITETGTESTESDQEAGQTDDQKKSQSAEEETSKTIPAEGETESAESELAESAPLTHQVRWGENLFRIGLHYGVDWHLIAEANNLVGHDIEAGQILIIPTRQTLTDSSLPLIHTVQPGENLYRIGLKYGLSWSVIAQANYLLNPNKIQAGQQLVIPASESPAAPADGDSSSTNQDVLTHVVRPGENLFRIGLQYNTNWNTIAVANNLPNANTIYANQELVIPLSSSTALAAGHNGANQLLVNGHRMFIQCMGTGSPTVILEAGLGDNSNTWSEVMPQVATFTQVCAYDRAGLGQSEALRVNRTSQDMAADWYRLLQTADIEGPYIVVGHSLGGYNARIFAATHQAKVVGLVLVDSSHPEQNERLAQVLPPETADESESLHDFRMLVTAAPDDPSMNMELWNIAASAEQAGRYSSLGDLPLIVVTAGNKEQPADFPAEIAQEIDQVWLEMQRELAQLSTDSKHLIAQKSGHHIQLDQPELVVQAIRQLVEATDH